MVWSRTRRAIHMPHTHHRACVSVCCFVAQWDLVLLLNSIFFARAHATWQKAPYWLPSTYRSTSTMSVAIPTIWYMA